MLIYIPPNRILCTDMEVIFDEYKMRELPPQVRLTELEKTLRFEENEAKRWPCVFLLGELTELQYAPDKTVLQRIADQLEWTLLFDKSPIVAHEGAFQIGLRNIVDKRQALIDVSLNNKFHDITRHESIEALGAQRAYECLPMIIGLENDESEGPAVRDTARFVRMRLELLIAAGSPPYKGDVV